MQTTSDSSDDAVPSDAIKLKYSRTLTRLGRRGRAAAYCMAAVVVIAALGSLTAAAASSVSNACGGPVERPRGVSWELGTAAAQKKIEIFGDFQCSDTKAAWSSVIEPLLAQHAHHVSLVFHPFPLPYHHSAFDAAQAAIIVAEAIPATPFAQVASAFFRAQASYYTAATSNLSQRQVFSDVLAPIATGLGVDERIFLERMRNSSDPSNGQARVAWKYGAAHGVSGTPTFATNGVIADELAAWSLAEWEGWVGGVHQHC